MFKRLDRCMSFGAVLYIALPVLIFFAAWLRPIIAIPACLIVAIGVFLALKNGFSQTDWKPDKKQILVFLLSVLILALWLLLSGHGGLAFQNSDYHDRNAIFHDLIEKPWPVTYDFSRATSMQIDGLNALPSSAILTYYIAYWLPAALVGKLFGFAAGNAALYLWALSGLTFVLYLLFRTLKKASFRAVFIWIFFSGLDLLGYMWATKGQLPSPISHIEWWSGFQYSSLTTLLFWVFNQSLVFWLAILVVENMKNSKSLFFLYALLLLYGPFPFLGMLPFVLVKAYEGLSPFPGHTFREGLRKLPGAFFTGIRRAISFENILAGVTVLGIVFVYFYGNVAAGRYMGVSKQLSVMYFIFLIFEAVLWLILTGAVYYRNPTYIWCAVSLAVIPLFQVGIGQDFCMRVSIPAIFVLMTLVAKILAGRDPATTLPEPEAAAKQGETADALSAKAVPASGEKRFFVRTAMTDRDYRLLRGILCVMLVIGAAVPVQEMLRSVWYTVPYYSAGQQAMRGMGEALSGSDNEILRGIGSALTEQSANGSTTADDKKTLANVSITTTNFVASTEGNLFWEYFARRSDA